MTQFTHTSDRELLALQDGELGDVRRRSVEDHVDRCFLCHRQSQVLQEERSALEAADRPIALGGPATSVREDQDAHRIVRALECIGDAIEKPPPEFLRRVVREACALVHADAGCLWFRVKGADNRLASTAHFGEAEIFRSLGEISMNSFSGHVVQTGRTRAIFDIRDDSEFELRSEVSHTPLHSVIGIPLLSQGEGVVGVFNVYSCELPRAFIRERTILEAFSKQVTRPLLEHRSAQATMKNRLLDLLRQSHEVSGGLGSRDAAQAKAAARADVVAIFPYDSESRRFKLGEAAGKGSQLFRQEPPRENGISATMIRTGQPYPVPDVRLDSLVNPRVALAGMGSFCGAPLFHQERPVGVIYLDWINPRRGFGQQFYKLMNALCAATAKLIARRGVSKFDYTSELAHELVDREIELAEVV